jgi:hypothetical protein
MMLYGWLVIAVFARFADNCFLARRELTRGSPDVGRALTEFSVLHGLLAVFLLTFLSSLLSLGAASVGKKRLAVSGVRLRPLVLAELAALSINPMSWVALLFALPACVPLLALPHPAAPIGALAAATVAVVVIAQALGQAVSLTRTARRIAGAFRFLFAAVMLGLVAANFDFTWSDGTIRVSVFQQWTLLADPAGKGLLPLVRPWSLSTWVLQGRMPACVALAAVAGLLFVLVAALSYRAAGKGPDAPRVLRARRDRFGANAARSRRGGARLPALVLGHELRYLAFTGGSITGTAAAIGCSAWLLAAREPTIGIAILGAIIVLLSGFSYSSNIFGHDGSALRRYALASADWGLVVAAKNRAWVLVSAATLLPLLAAAAVRDGVRAALALALTSTAALLVSMLWGNISSLLLPSTRAPAGAQAGVGGSGKGTPFVNQAGPFAICAIPLAIHRAVAPFGSGGYDAAVGACIVAAAIAYMLFLRRVRATFDSELETILDRF